MNNQRPTTIMQNKPKFSAMLQTNAFQKSLHNAMGNPKEIQKFTAAITSVVSTNPQLEECEASTILSAALCGHALALPPSPQLGLYYMVPFKRKAVWKNGKMVQPETQVATFVLGYRGYIQLAIRSGQYKRLNVIEVKEGELLDWDPLTEEIHIKMINDEVARETAETVGYYAYFRYINGFEKAIYWTKDKMKQHALKYSKGYASDIEKGTSFTFWAKDFDSMAKKTMLRQLISKWGVMSVEMHNAYIADGAVIDKDGNPEIYSDDNMIEAEFGTSQPNDSEVINQPQNQPQIDEDPYAGTPFADEPQSFSIDDLAE